MTLQKDLKFSKQNIEWWHEGHFTMAVRKAAVVQWKMVILKDNHKNGDDPTDYDNAKNEDDLKNEDMLKDEDDPKNGGDPKGRV